MFFYFIFVPIPSSLHTYVRELKKLQSSSMYVADSTGCGMTKKYIKTEICTCSAGELCIFFTEMNRT